MASLEDSGVQTSGPAAVANPARPNAPFAAEWSEAELDAVLAGPFSEYVDPARFGPPRTLRDILRHEARTVRFEDGDIVVREGDYGGSVFVILEGRLRALLDPKGSRHIAGRVATGKLGWLASLRAVRGRSRVPEERRDETFPDLADLALRQVDAETARTFVRNVDKVVRRYETAPMEAGEVFGEIAALSRSPRTATVFAEGRARVLELRWQGLRELRKRDPGFRTRLDELYRSRSFISQLRQTPLFRRLDDEALQALADGASFESFGEYEWFRAFRKVEQEDAAEVLELETMVAEEGTEVRDLIVIRSGFARISRRHDHGHRTVGYLRHNEVFGLEEILAHARGEGDLRLRASLRAVGYVDVLKFPVALVEAWLLPRLAPRSVPAPTRAPESRLGEILEVGGLDQPLLDFLVDRRIVNGTAAMLIDADRCVACDACVEACALAHDGNPRFLRAGPVHAQVQFASACLHCVDPVCLIGCPTGAIQRSLEGPVIIEEKTCIGCGTCAGSCPYDTIRMVQVRDAAGAPKVDEAQRRPVLEATKCDLCSAQPGGPACARACPHDALIRIDLRDRSRLAEWIEGKGRLARAGWAAALTALALAAAWALRDWAADTLGHPDRVTGWTLLGSVAFLALLAARKALPTLPLGRVFTWTQAHVWAGFFGLGAFALHAGAALPNGPLESLLWLTFLAVAGSGVVGLAMSRGFPPRMRRHGELLLLERIPRFRRELAEKVEALALQSVRETASSTLADFHAARLAPYFARRRNALAHLVESRRPLSRLEREIRHLERYLDPRGRELLAEIAECVAAKDNLDYQETLQRALRGWRYLHRPGTAALTLLIVIHVVLVYTFGS